MRSLAEREQQKCLSQTERHGLHGDGVGFVCGLGDGVGGTEQVVLEPGVLEVHIGTGVGVGLGDDDVGAGACAGNEVDC